jgi:Tol biopolymer transport system component
MDLPKGKIVFSSNVDGDSEIYAMNVNGTDLKQLTKNSATTLDTGSDDEPSFCFNGKKITFASSRQGRDRELIYDYRGKVIGSGSSKAGTSDIYIMNSDGKYQIPLTYNTLSSQPFFSPDDTNVIFNTLLLGNKRQNLLKMLNIYNGSEKTLNIGGGQVEFSVDGKKMFDNFEHDISVTDVDRNNRIKLTHFSDNRDKEPELGIHFAISLDGEKLICITDETRKVYRTDGINDFYDIFEFYTMDVDGSNLEKIYKIDGLALEELYRSDEARRTSKGVIRSTERLPDGSLKTVVYKHSDLIGNTGVIWKFKFSPDGKDIIFNADFYSKSGIYLLNLENKNVISLTGKKERWFRVIDFIFTPDGKKIVFVAEILPKNYDSKAAPAVIFRIVKSYIYLFLLRKDPFPINKYICIMDIDGKNYRRIAKLPSGTELGHDFIHWEQ